FFSSRRRHTRSYGDWSSDVCSSDLIGRADIILNAEGKQITPSAVYLGPTDSETLVGDPAERKLGQEKVDQRRFVFSVKRDLMRAPTKVLDGKAYSPVKVASLILAKLREDADK